MKNPYDLYEEDVDPGRRMKATKAITAAITRAIKTSSNVDVVFDRVMRVADKYRDVGASDTASQDEIYRQIELRLGVDRVAVK